MDVRETLVELILSTDLPLSSSRESDALNIADVLIAHGVTVQKSSCPYCCDNGAGHGMMKHSYDDDDGLDMSIHPSTREENGYQSLAWGATVGCRGECGEFYMEVCPFCGRRLGALKEEMETAMPQPPKGE